MGEPIKWGKRYPLGESVQRKAGDSRLGPSFGWGSKRAGTPAGDRMCRRRGRVTIGCSGFFRLLKRLQVFIGERANKLAADEPAARRVRTGVCDPHSQRAVR